MKSIMVFALLVVVISSCRPAEADFDASGTFEAVEVMVSSEAAGTIEAFDAHEGLTVSKGQSLGWIDSTQLYLKKKQLIAQIEAILSRRPQIATQLASYRIQLETAQREHKRLQSLFEAEAATEKQLDDAAAQVAVIKKQIEAHRSSLDITSQGMVSETLPLSAQVEQVDDQISRTLIVSPIDGTILNRYVEVSELVTPGKPLFKVADISTMELRAYITGQQLPGVKLNQPVSVFVDDTSGGYHELKGTLSWVSSKAEFTPKTIQTKEERADLVYAVKVRVQNDGHLKIGMYGEVRF